MTTCRKRTDHRPMDGHDPKCANLRALPERGQHQARIPGPPGGMAGDAPVRQTGQQAHVRPAVLLQFF